MTKPKNFPERKRQRQLRASEGGDNLSESGIPEQSLRDVRTKKYRGKK